MLTPRVIFVVIAIALCPTLGVADEAPKFADLSVIAVNPGTNKIAGFAPDGHDGTVTKAWRDNGNAHGFNVFTVMLRDRKAPKDEEWELVSFFDGDAETLTLTDAPHTFEDFVRSVRFARGTLDGHRETLAIISNRNLLAGGASPTKPPYRSLCSN